MMKLPAYFTGFSSKSDGSASLRFNTQEIPDSEFATLKRHHNAFGWLLFDEQDIADDEIPSELPDDTSKSPSQRLRSVLYIIFKDKKMEGDFNSFYRIQLEKVIDHFKKKLPLKE